MGRSVCDPNKEREKMKVSKIILATLCAVSLLPATLRAAEANLDLPVNSAYVWRGQVLNDEAVFQPSLTASADNGLSFNAWSSFNLTDSLGKGLEREFSEVDLLGSYDVPVKVVDLTIGAVEYLFPNQTLVTENEDGTTSSASVPSTREAFVTVGKEDLLLSPSASVYYDFGQVNGYYGMVSVSQGYEVTKELALSATLSVGAGNSDYNQTYFGVDDTALNDGNAKLGASYAFNESLTVSAYAMYTYLLDSDIRDAAKSNDVYFNKGDILSGGVSLGYGF
jgi:outer membrane scaffolding protein for murein synthesis (MipA/OmpV family)